MFFSSKTSTFVPKSSRFLAIDDMKKLFILSFLTMFAMGTYAQTQSPKVNTSEVRAQAVSKAENYAEIKFDTLRYNFGKFSASNPEVKCAFTFTNTGTAPLIIHQAFASCGCTVPTFTKEPIKPGERGQINVTYNGKGKFPGHFQKTITVRSNAVSEVVRLTIEGEMEDDVKE